MEMDLTREPFRSECTALFAFKIIVAGVLALALAANCAHSCEIVREKFDAFIKELRNDGRLIVTSAGRDVVVLLVDYNLPKKGDSSFAALRKVLSVARSMPIACEVEKKYENDTYAVCMVEGRVSLAVVFEQWGIAGAKDTSRRY